MPGIRCPNNFTPSGEGSLLTGVRPLAAPSFGRGADPSSHSWRALKAVAARSQARADPDGRTAKSGCATSGPLTVPPTLPHIVIGGCEDKGE